MKRFLQELLICLLLFFWSSVAFAQDKAIKILYDRLKDPVTSIESSAQIYRQLTRLYAKQHNYAAALEVAQKRQIYNEEQKAKKNWQKSILIWLVCTEHRVPIRRL
ncbi:MAG: hypothetical protein JKY03_09725 [Aureispira sp.]|nr:hypothetical protein [Aureispira sp.]